MSTNFIFCFFIFFPRIREQFYGFLGFMKRSLACEQQQQKKNAWIFVLVLKNCDILHLLFKKCKKERKEWKKGAGGEEL